MERDGRYEAPPKVVYYLELFGGNYFVILLVDDAGWHKARSPKIPKNVSLITRPWPSPQLNTAKRLWDELSENYSITRLFEP